LGSWGDDIGLLYLVLLNAAVLLASWRLARRRSADALDAAGDALLLFYFVQYISVCVTGVAGAMHVLTIGLVALLASAFIALGSWRIRPREAEGREGASDERRDVGGVAASHGERRIVDHAPTLSSSLKWRDLWLQRRHRVLAAGAIMFVVGYLASLIYHQRPLPVISNDAITYHLPAAVQWLQTGRIGLYEAWYYNPANSYSPLGGSAFVAWLIAPLQNDSIARFVAVGPLLMLMIAMLNVCRRLGLDPGVAALVAAACALARTFASQAILAKDDLFVAAFFVILVDALSRERLSTRSGPFRVGIALGLLLATKYTVLFSLPLLLLMFNRAWTIRRMLIAAGVALLIAGPWYWRNVRMTGNPLYPAEVTIGGVTIFSGMMEIARSRLLQSPRGVWEVFVGGYYGLTRPMAIVLVVGWVATVGVAIARSRRRGDGDIARGKPPPADVADRSHPLSRPRGLADPLTRTCVIGPVIGIAIFALTAPYGEMRFAYPSVALLFACLAIALTRLPWAAQTMLAAGVMILAAFTAFRPDLSQTFVSTGAAIALPAMLIALAPRPIAKRIVLAAGGVAMIALALLAYVNWGAYVRQADADSAVAWADPTVYGPMADVWRFIRNDDASAAPVGAIAPGAGVSRGATIAYANTFFTYPLMGYRYDHRVVHVPTRRDIEHFRDLPRLPRGPKKITGEEIVPAIAAELRVSPDRDAWLRRLRESGAQYLVIAKHDPAAPTQRITPPEQLFAEQQPQHFIRIFDNDAGSVFRIAW
jgi:hypothetical protein